MISGTTYRRRRALLWSTLASALIHLVVLTALFYAVARIIVSRGQREVVSQQTLVTIEQRPRAKAAKLRKAHRVHQNAAPPAKTPPHELAREVTTRAPYQPPHRPTVASTIERDEAGYAKVVAQLNAQNDPRAIPTIDPSLQESRTKSYQFAIPSALRGSDQGNGVITPVQSWREHGEDCYYGRYEFTYPDGSMEDGNIVWPFCFDPAADPFHEPPHQIPFPLPLPGFRLPPNTQLPPIEKSVYEQWAAINAKASSAP